MKRLIILGAGGYGKTIADVATQSCHYGEICFLDDHNDDAIDKCDNFTLYINGKTEFYPAFGDNEMRIEWLNRLMDSGCGIATIIHPSAYVSPTTNIQQGTVVLPHAIINTSCTIKMGCIINCGATIDHDCTLEEGVHICLGVIIKADNHIPRCMKIEAGQVIQNSTYPLRRRT